MKKRTIYIIVATVLASALFSSCKSEFITYDGPEYIAFADTLTTVPVQNDGKSFAIDLVSTTVSDKDRTFGIEVVNEKGTTAIYGKHYTLVSQTVVIPAGERIAKVEVLGKYDALPADEDPTFFLKVVCDDKLKWDLYGDQIKVLLAKVCPFDINTFNCECQVSSGFLVQYSQDGDYQRICQSEVIDAENNIIVIHDFIYDGYDVKFKFDVSDLVNPTFEMVGEQTVADTRVAFGTVYGDGRLLGSDYPSSKSDVRLCQRYVFHTMLMWVEGVGTVGAYNTIIEWENL